MMRARAQLNKKCLVTTHFRIRAGGPHAVGRPPAAPPPTCTPCPHCSGPMLAPGAACAQALQLASCGWLARIHASASHAAHARSTWAATVLAMLWKSISRRSCSTVSRQYTSISRSSVLPSRSTCTRQAPRRKARARVGAALGARAEPARLPAAHAQQRQHRLLKQIAAVSSSLYSSASSPAHGTREAAGMGGPATVQTGRL